MRRKDRRKAAVHRRDETSGQITAVDLEVEVHPLHAWELEREHTAQVVERTCGLHDNQNPPRPSSLLWRLLKSQRELMICMRKCLPQVWTTVVWIRSSMGSGHPRKVATGQKLSGLPNGGLGGGEETGEFQLPSPPKKTKRIGSRPH